MKGEDTYDEGLTLSPGQWQVHPSTGVVSLKEEAFQDLLNSKPIESIYVLDPEPIARGQFAVVYHCTHRHTGKEYAAKFSSKVRLGADCSSDLIHEIAVSAMLKPSAKAIHLVDVFSSEGQLILVMEYAPGGDLQTLLDENLVPYETDVIKFMRQLLEGLAFIHERNIVHLDIKPQNLVLMGEFPNCAVKLCDFEISRMLTPGYEIREILGTPDYVAPEILHYEPITTRTDMWSVGVLTYVLLTGFLPFGGESDQETFVEILKGEVDFPSELFEDITPEAIDFIKKLLVKQPEQRMSAKECLNHTWMKKGLQRPKPPSTLDLTSSLNQQMSSTPAITVVATSATSPTEGSPKPDGAHPVLQKSPSESSKILQDFTTPSRDIGRPPLYPSSSQKSLLGESFSVAGTPVTTPGPTLSSPFVYPRQESRFGSRHNLDRLRSMSKSREVLSERVQMSNIKKSMSKSRERLNDAKLGMSKSREKLMALSSLSQSVEVLSALSHLTQQSNMYQSCNNIFVPKLHLPNTGNSPGRMYQSMAAIDQIDNMNNLRKMGYFESRISLNGDDYNDILTQRNTDMNSFIGDLKFDKLSENKSASGLRGNSCKGGRGDTCDSRCSRHRQSDSKQTQNPSKLSRAEKMKKEAQRRRKEKREKERREHLKKQRERQKNAQSSDGGESPKPKVNDGSSSPSFRRGSVSHVEQRIQERHERNQEKLEKQEREEKNRRRYSLDHEKSNTIERSKRRSSATLDVPDQRSRSSTPTRRKTRKESPLGSDISQTSSMESVNTTTDKAPTDLTNSSNEINMKIESVDKMEENNNIMDINMKTDEGIEADEAYVSLEDPSLDNLSRSKSTESASSDESDKTVVENPKKETSSSSEDELELETLSVSEKIFGFEKGIFVELKKTPSLKQKNIVELIEKTSEKDLPSIAEEGSSPSLSLTPPDFRRSISNTSDFGSLISESTSEGSVEKEVPQLSSPTNTINEQLSPEWKSRARSHSVYSTPSPPLSSPSPRSRSNSFNFDVTENVARPWGTVCSGSVARAFEKFNLKSTESPKRSPSPAASPSEENCPSTKFS